MQMAAAQAWLVSQASAGEEMQVWLGLSALVLLPQPRTWELFGAQQLEIDVLCDLASVFQIFWIQTFANLGDLIEYILK